MSRWIPPLCLAASIGAVWLTVAVFYRLRRRPLAPVVPLPVSNVKAVPVTVQVRG